MIAVDTSSFIAYLQDEKGRDISLVGETLEANQLVFPPMVVTELLSDPKLPQSVTDLIIQVPMLDLEEGFWVRAGELRAKLLGRKLKSRIADALIAQICIDYHTPLITRDHDFRHYQKYGLKLAAFSVD